ARAVDGSRSDAGRAVWIPGPVLARPAINRGFVMFAGQLKPEQFDGYPPEAKRLAASHIALLRQLPLGFLPLLLKELIVYDWKFPAERKELDKQFTYLASLSPAQFDREMSSFSGLRLSPELENFD